MAPLTCLMMMFAALGCPLGSPAPRQAWLAGLVPPRPRSPSRFWVVGAQGGAWDVGHVPVERGSKFMAMVNGGGHGRVKWSVGGSHDVAPPCLAFWFESTASLCDGPVHFAFLTWLGLQSKINRSIFREDVLERGPTVLYSLVFGAYRNVMLTFFRKQR